MANAHRISHGSNEAWILRLYRQTNRKGWIKGITDRPEQLVMGFHKVEKILKSLWLSNMFIWPRFQAFVQQELSKVPLELEECTIRATPSTTNIQHAMHDLMTSCLSELRRVRPTMDMQGVTPDKLLLDGFSQQIKVSGTVV